MKYFGKLVVLTRDQFRKPTSAFGTSIVYLFILAALFGAWLAPYGANEQIPEDARQPPSYEHSFGTDNLGRDVYSRVIIGARDILALAGIGTLTAVFFGVILGLLSGYRGGLDC